MQRIAAAHITINGQQYRNHVVELDQQGRVLRHYPLTEELPHTMWYQKYDTET